MPRTFVIAEAGVNHNGSPEVALRLVDAAADAGADAVKFQTFRAHRVVTKSAAKASYQKVTTGSDEGQIEMLRRLELDRAAHEAIVERCRARGIEFLSTPFDEESLELLLGLGVGRIKVPSGELTNAPFLRAVARTRLPLIVSTGMSTLGEVEAALAVLTSEELARDGASERSPDASLLSLSDDLAWGAIVGRVTLLHCTTEYPAPLASVNLRVLGTLAQAFGLRVGYSDHTPGIAVPLAAVALGACIIEKHFTLDRELPGPDHKASLVPHELAAMVDGIRAVEVALGGTRKVVSDAERGNRSIARRSLVALQPIAEGATYTTENLGAKRPAAGISPMRFDELVGRTARRSYDSDELIDPTEA